MSNFFAGISRANDALTAARYGLQVTGQNIANADTPGYTRQVARQSAVGTAVGVPTLHTGQVSDGGVRVSGADRLSDAVLDRRARAEHARSASVNTVAARLADVENIFKEPSDTGLANQLQDFWDAWGDVANDAGSQVPREMLIQSAQGTVTMLHTMDSALTDVSNAAQESLKAQVADVNTAAADLSELNRKIAIGHATGADTNALLDQRDVLLDKISTAVGGEATIHDNGTASVTVGGKDFVTVGTGGTPPFTPGTLAATVTGPTPPSTAVTVSMDITIADGSGTSTTTPVSITDGTAGAEVTAITDTVPHYRSMLNDVAKALADTVNGIQGDGYDRTGAAGADMLTGTTAKDIEVASGFTWKNVAAGLDATAGGTNDGANALDASNAAALPGSPDRAYTSLIGDLGRTSASAQQQQATQAVITNSVDTLHATSSGVSFDEEVSNMLTYQKAFQASSRVLTALDEMLDTLINRTGLVGR